MHKPTTCPRCHAIAQVPGRLEGAGAIRVAVDDTHASAVTAWICTACGCVELKATDPAGLRPVSDRGHGVQEYDF